MKMNIGNLLNINTTLKSIMDSEEIHIDALLKFKFLGILKSIEPHIENYELIRNEKIREYGEEDEEGNYLISKDDTERYDNFRTDMESILNNTVDVSFEKLDAKEIIDLGLTSDQLIQLYELMEG